jgi:hypothetical protein
VTTADGLLCWRIRFEKPEFLQVGKWSDFGRDEESQSSS